MDQQTKIPQHCILILEDQPQNRQMICDICVYAGFKVLPAETLVQARTYLESDTRIDLALLDLNLPDGSGLSLVSPLRLKYPDIVIFLVTAAITYENVHQAMDLGVDKVIAKPFTPRQLLAEIEAFTGWTTQG